MKWNIACVNLFKAEWWKLESRDKLNLQNHTSNVQSVCLLWLWYTHYDDVATDQSSDQWRSVVLCTVFLFQLDAASARPRLSLVSDKHVPAWVPISCNPEYWDRDCWEVKLKSKHSTLDMYNYCVIISNCLCFQAHMTVNTVAPYGEMQFIRMLRLTSYR